MIKKSFIIFGLLFAFLTNHQVYANQIDKNTPKKQDLVLHETFQVNPDMEMLISHEFYKGIKIKGVRIKQVEIYNDTTIKDGKAITGDPNRISFVIELMDMKGKTIEVYGSRPLQEGDYTYIVEQD